MKILISTLNIKYIPSIHLPHLSRFVVSFSSGPFAHQSLRTTRHRWVSDVGHNLGSTVGLILWKVVIARDGYGAEKPAVPPIHSATGETHFIGPGPSDVHNGANLVPAVGYRVMDSDLLTDPDPGKWLGVLVVPDRDVPGMSSCTAITVLGLGLPLLSK